MRNPFRGFDAKLVVALIALVIVATACWQAIERQQEVTAKGERIDALIQTIQTQQKASAQARIDATEERGRLLANQRALLRRTEGLERQLTALRRLLMDAGIEVPADSAAGSVAPDADPEQTKPRPNDAVDPDGAGEPPGTINKPPPRPPVKPDLCVLRVCVDLPIA